MKKQLYFFTLLFFTFFWSEAQVAINEDGSTPNSNAMLDVSSTTKGMLIPRMSTTDRTALALGSTEDGLFVYDTDTHSFWYWNGSAWNDMGNSALNEDKDWLKEGTTEAPTADTDAMYHTGNVAIGKNTATTKLDVFQDSEANTLKVENANTNTGGLRTAAYFDVGGAPTNTTGKMAVYATVGDQGSVALIGIETDVFGSDTNNQYQYGMQSDISGNNPATHVGAVNYLHGNGTGNRYGVLNALYGSSSGLIIGTYEIMQYTGDGEHMGTYMLMTPQGEGVHYGAFNRISLLPSQQNATPGNNIHIGVVNEIKNVGNADHVGTLNALGLGVHEDNPYGYDNAIISGDSDARRVGTLNTIAGDGNGMHIGTSNNIISTGNGYHVAVNNVIGYDYLHQTNTTTQGYQVGTINNLTDLGNHAHIGTSNIVGLILDPTNPTNPVPVSGDGAGKRVGEVNMVAGDGAGDHFGVMNTVYSTGDGKHIASYNQVLPGGTGQHIAVYGEVDNNDPTAMAGVFKGDVTARNYLSTIQIMSGVLFNDDSSSFTDKSTRYIVSFDPTVYHKLGAIQIKVVVNITAFNGNESEHHFRVKAVQNNNVYATPIADTDTWTWTQLSGGNYMIESEWKTWNAGTDPWSVRFQIKNDTGSLQLNNIYYLIRPAQP